MRAGTVALILLVPFLARSDNPPGDVKKEDGYSSAPRSQVVRRGTRTIVSSRTYQMPSAPETG